MVGQYQGLLGFNNNRRLVFWWTGKLNAVPSSATSVEGKEQRRDQCYQHILHKEVGWGILRKGWVCYEAQLCMDSKEGSGTVNWCLWDTCHHHNFKESKIQYGDSIGSSINEDLEDVLTWWTHQHTERHFATSYLLTTQQWDGHSCRILAWNALAIYILPTTYSLMDTKAIATERLWMFLQFTNHHNEKVYYNITVDILVLISIQSLK